MKFKPDSMPLGVFLGLISPILTLIGYYLIKYSYMSIHGFINYLVLGGIYLPVISLCVVTNLLVFFIFIWRENYLTCRGVLLSTFLYAGGVLFFKMLS